MTNLTKLLLQMDAAKAYERARLEYQRGLYLQARQTQGFARVDARTAGQQGPDDSR